MKLAVLLPAFEEASISTLIQELVTKVDSIGFGVNIFVVDDGSTHQMINHIRDIPKK